MPEPIATSIVDVVLHEYGFVWKLNPYRIVDYKTGKVVASGPVFSMVASELKKMRKAFDKSEAK